MEKIYAPWRHGYVTKQDRPAKKKEELKNECIFCDQLDQDEDEKHLILRRFDNTFVMMNYYPYNAGHIMVLPFEHKPDLQDLTPEIRAELMEATTVSAQIIQKTMKCDGMNIGINLGVAGGGGIPAHLHVHILPRWKGDTNFLATLADTTLVCSPFHQIYKDLQEPFAQASIK